MSYPYPRGNHGGHAFPINGAPAQSQMYQGRENLQLNQQSHTTNGISYDPYGQQRAVSFPPAPYATPLYHGPGPQTYHQAPLPRVNYQQPFQQSHYGPQAGQSNAHHTFHNSASTDQQMQLADGPANFQRHSLLSQPQRPYSVHHPPHAQTSVDVKTLYQPPQSQTSHQPQDSALPNQGQAPNMPDPRAAAVQSQQSRPLFSPASTPRQPIRPAPATARVSAAQRPHSPEAHSASEMRSTSQSFPRSDTRFSSMQQASRAQEEYQHLQTPVDQRSSRPHLTEMAPPTKRRKSNDLETIVVSHTKDPSPRHHGSEPQKQAATASVKPSTGVFPRVPETPSSAPDLDYQSALLALSDEYISAAYSISASLSEGEGSADQFNEYYSYLASGMGCLESVLNNYRIPDARKEARIRLRLASLLYEETENDMDAETILSKGIALCDRARLTDLRYSMNHLLARIWYKGGQKRAAIKAVDKVIDEVEKLQLTHWLYAFRFLRVSFSLQEETFHSDAVNVIKQLTSIANKANEQGDHAVHILASALEALTHVRVRTPDCVELAQTALAAARTHQFTKEFQSMPQARALLDCVDLACNLNRLNSEQAAANLTSLHANLDAYYKDSSQSKSGQWILPLRYNHSSVQDISADTGGIMAGRPDGKLGLSFTWLTRTQATTLGFLLSALTNLQKHNAETGGKTGSYLQEGMKMNGVAPEKIPRSLAVASTHAAWQRQMRILLQLYAVFTCCVSSEWEKAMGYIRNIRTKIADNPDDRLGDNLAALMSYLEGTCKHSLGDLEGALQLYKSPALELPTNVDSRAFAASDSCPLKVLAALNSVTALRKIGTPEEADSLLTLVEPLCVVQKNSNGNDHGSKALASAFYVLKATTSEMSIIKTKHFIQLAIQAAQTSKNDKLLTIVMNHMAQLFFATIVGEQALRCSDVARKLALKTGDDLWTAVADGMSSDALVRTGKLEEAAEIRREGYEAMARLPTSLKEALPKSHVG